MKTPIRASLLGFSLGLIAFFGIGAAFTGNNLFTTPFTRGLLRAVDQSAAQIILGVSGGGGGSAPVGTVLTNGTAAAGDIAAFRGTGATNIGKATLSDMTNALALTGSTSTFLSSAGTQIAPPAGGTAGSVINTTAAIAGAPLVLSGTDPTNAIPSFGGEPIFTVSTNYTLTYTNNGVFFICNSATNVTWTLSDGATNGWNFTVKNLGAGSVILTNTAGKTFDGLAGVTNLSGTIYHWIADGSNYRGGRGSPKNLNGPNTFFASPADGSTGVMAPRAIVAADVAASIVTGLQTNATLASLGGVPLTGTTGTSGTLYFPTLSAGQFQSICSSNGQAGTITCSLDSTNYNIWVLTGAVTIATSNLATNRTWSGEFWNPQATNCNITWPTGMTNNGFAGGYPTYVNAGKKLFLALRCTLNANDTNVSAIAVVSQ